MRTPILKYVFIKHNTAPNAYKDWATTPLRIMAFFISLFPAMLFLKKLCLSAYLRIILSITPSKKRLSQYIATANLKVIYSLKKAVVNGITVTKSKKERLIQLKFLSLFSMK